MLMLATSFKSILFEYSYEALLLILIISAPPIILASIVGIMVAIFQAATQIQEQTLTFVPKLFAIFITIILAGNFMITVLLEFTRYVFRMISQL